MTISSPSAVHRKVRDHGQGKELRTFLHLLILILPNFLPVFSLATDNQDQAKATFSKDVQELYIAKMAATYEDPLDALRILGQELSEWNLVEDDLVTVTLPLTSTSNDSANSSSSIVAEIKGKFSTLGITLSQETSDIIAILGSKTDEKGNQRTNIVAIGIIRDVILNERTWYKFLQQTITSLSTFDIQKERSQYNSPDLNNWGQGSNSSGGPHLKDVEDLQLLVQKLTQTFPNTSFPSAASLTTALTLNPEIKDSKLNDLNSLLQTILNDPLTCLYEPWTNTVEVTGNFILLSQIVGNSKCLRKGSHTLTIHANDTLFIDTDILGHTINATHNLNIMAFAPRWMTIGNPTINLSGKDGQPWDGPAPNGTNGQPGRPGGNAGSFVGTALVFEGNVPTFLVNASKGGPGQDGGPGETKAPRPNNVKPMNDGLIPEDAFLSPFEIFQKRLKEYEEDKGGDGGDGGKGALGGTSGTALLTRLGRIFHKVGLDKDEIVEGQRAENGKGGIGGKGRPRSVTTIEDLPKNETKYGFAFGVTNKSVDGQEGRNGANIAGLENPPRQISLSSLELTQLYKTHLTRHVSLIIEKDHQMDYTSEWYQNGTKFQQRHIQANITMLDKFRHPLSILQQLYHRADLLTWADLGNLTFLKDNEPTSILDSKIQQELIGQLKFSLPSRKLEISRRIERIWDFSHLTLKQRLNSPQNKIFSGLSAIKAVTLATLKEGALWSDFLSQLYLGFSTYDIQKNRELYNVNDLDNWGKNESTRSSDTAPNIQKSKVKQFMQLAIKSLQLSKSELDRKFLLKDLKASGIDENIDRLNRILSFLLYDKMKCTTQTSKDDSSSTVIVRGNFVLLSHVLKPSCLPQGTNSLVIFAVNTIFLDANITGRAINPVTNLNISIFSPKWVTVERDLIFDLDGQPRFEPADLTFFQNDPNPKAKLKAWMKEGKDFLVSSDSDWNALEEQVDRCNSTSEVIEFLKSHANTLNFLNPAPKSIQVGVKANPGKSGLSGGPAGNFFGLVSTLEGVTLSLPHIKVDGGRGGPGQPGQEGANGTDGLGGIFKLKQKNYWGQDSEILAELQGKDHKIFKCNETQNTGLWKDPSIFTCYGLPGSPGSDGGVGGVGGKGGAMGKVILGGFANSNQANNITDLKVWTGSPGADGQGGSGGKGGSGGMGEEEWSYPCKWDEIGGMGRFKRCSDGYVVRDKKPAVSGQEGEGSKSSKPIRSYPEFKNRPLEYLDIYRQLALPQVADNKDNIGGNLLGQFLTSLDTNPGLAQVRDRPLASFYDFQGLELALNKIKQSHPQFLDILPFYSKLMDRIYKEAENTNNNNSNTVIKIDPKAYRLALYNLYTAAYSRLMTLQEERSLTQSPALIVNIQGYIEDVYSQLESLEKAQQDEEKVHFIKSENQKYRKELESRMEEAKTAITELIEPQLKALQDSIQNSSVALTEEILDTINATQTKVQEKAEQIEKLKKQKVRNILFGAISMVGDTIKVIGPGGAIAGALVKTGSEIGQTATTASEDTLPAAAKIPEAFSNFKTALTTKFEKDTEKLNQEFKWRMGNASKILEDNTPDEDELDKEDEDYKEIINYRKGIQDKIKEQEARIAKIVEDRKLIKKTDSTALLGSFETEREIQISTWDLETHLEDKKKLIEEKLKKDKSNKFREWATEKIDYLDKASTVVGLGLAIATKAGEDQKAVDKATDEMTELEQNVANGYDLYQGVQSTFRPFLANLQSELADQSASSNKTTVGLDISRWQIQTTLTKVKGLLQKYTKGLAAGDEMTAAFDALNSGLTTIINIYDKIQGFLDQSRLANYIGAINSVSFRNLKTGNDELDRAVTNLGALSQAQLVQQKFGEALNSFKMWIFPYALKFLPHLLTLNNFPMMQFINTTNTCDFDDGSLSATANAESIVRLTIDSVKTRLGSIPDKLKNWKVRVDKIDKKLRWGEFYDFQSMKPFFIWKNGVNLDSKVVYRLLKGDTTVLLKANILTRPSKFNAIKFNQIELKFVIPEDTPDLPEDTRKNLVSNLTRFLNTRELWLTHSGQSVYGYNGAYYSMTTENITFVYTFEEDVNGHPVSRSWTVDKVGAGDVSLSPYTMWQARIVDPNGDCKQKIIAAGGISMMSSKDYANLNCSRWTPIKGTTTTAMAAQDSTTGKESSFGYGLTKEPEISDAVLEEISKWVNIQLVGNGTYISHLDSDPASELQLDKFYFRDDSLTF